MYLTGKFEKSLSSLVSYIEKEGYYGWDPFDGLNSKLLRHSQLNRLKIARLLWLQFFKKNPINLRKPFLVKKEYNPKGVGLLLTGYCNLYKGHQNNDTLERINFLAEKVIELQSNGYSGACWGYNFDWQSRAFFLPKWTPSIVVTSFVSNSLLDAYNITSNKKYLEIAIKSTKFITNDLNRTYTKNGYIFSYSPFDNTSVYNASLLGSKLLARIYSYTKDVNLLNHAKLSVQACIDDQNRDGSWVYGKLDIQNWIDSFHTGYNLECIELYQRFSNDNRFEENIESGFKFYLNRFFLDDGTPKYYHNKTYPIDIHCPAQLIVTLYHLNKLDEYQSIANKVLEWTLCNMHDKKGYFYYQKYKYWTNKIPYMRWSQAFMLYALSYFLRYINEIQE